MVLSSLLDVAAAMKMSVLLQNRKMHESKLNLDYVVFSRTTGVGEESVLW